MFVDDIIKLVMQMQVCSVISHEIHFSMHIEIHIKKKEKNPRSHAEHVCMSCICLLRVTTQCIPDGDRGCDKL